MVFLPFLQKFLFAFNDLAHDSIQSSLRKVSVIVHKIQGQQIDPHACAASLNVYVWRAVVICVDLELKRLKGEDRRRHGYIIHIIWAYIKAVLLGGVVDPD